MNNQTLMILAGVGAVGLFIYHRRKQSAAAAAAAAAPAAVAAFQPSTSDCGTFDWSCHVAKVEAKSNAEEPEHFAYMREFVS